MTRILIVDDEKTCREQAHAQLSSMEELEIRFAASGLEALEILSQDPASLVVTDLHMPTMDGLQLLKAVRDQFPVAPVIVMTGHGSEAVAAEALNSGASGYVSKKLLDSQLLPLVRKVLNSLAARRDQERIEHALDFTETRFVMRNDHDLGRPIIGYLQEKVNRLLRFSENELLLIGLAIDEALANAIYHGNLEVSSELRESDDDAFHALAAIRQKQAPFKHRNVYITGRVSSDAFECIVRDEGNGFRVDAVPDPLAEENLAKPSGRGLLLIRQFMDEVRHNDKANEITMVKRPARV